MQTQIATSASGVATRPKGIKILDINTLGVLYVVETGESIQSVEDLKGKTIYSTGKGTTPEFALNYILRENGIDPETDVTIEYKSEATEAAQRLPRLMTPSLCCRSRSSPPL